LKKYCIFFIFFTSLLLVAEISRNFKGNIKIDSFSKAKKILYNKIYKNLPKKTFYCGCSYKNRHSIDFNSCGFSPRKNAKRAKRVEAEHIVPASLFGRTFKSWTDGDPKCVTKKGKRYKGRRCSKKVSREFRLMEADLFNLYPAIGEVNGDRSNYEFAEIPGEKRVYGKCDVEIEGKKIEPREGIRGDIARTYFYMMKAYPERVRVSGEKMEMFREWDKLDPESAGEKLRRKTIRKVLGMEEKG